MEPRSRLRGCLLAVFSLQSLRSHSVDSSPTSLLVPATSAQSVTGAMLLSVPISPTSSCLTLSVFPQRLRNLSTSQLSIHNTADWFKFSPPSSAAYPSTVALLKMHLLPTNSKLSIYTLSQTDTAFIQAKENAPSSHPKTRLVWTACVLQQHSVHGLKAGAKQAQPRHAKEEGIGVTQQRSQQSCTKTGLPRKLH